jgi:hypothetical protein
MGFTWTTTPEQAFGPLVERFQMGALIAAFQLFTRYAPQVEAWMKQNAPWEDRTGNARQTLYTIVGTTPVAVVLTLAHGVGYGIHLETGHGGRFGIIGPAVDYWAGQIFADLQGILR